MPGGAESSDSAWAQLEGVGAQGSWGRQKPAGVLFCPLGSQPWAQGDGNCFSLLVLGRDRDGKPLSESMLGTLIYC